MNLEPLLDNNTLPPFAKRLRAGVKQSAFAYAYTSNILSVAYMGDLVDILVAILPCAWVYADYGRRLANEFADELDSNPYKPWIDMYRTDEFWASGRWLIDHIEPIARTLPESRLEQLETLFVRGVGYEYMFWDSAYRMQMQWKKEWQ